jgi:hypothetical protein
MGARISSANAVKSLHFSISSRPALGPTQSPPQWAPRARRSRREADHTPPTSAEANKTQIYTSPPQTSSWSSAQLNKHRATFSFDLAALFLIQYKLQIGGRLVQFWTFQTERGIHKQDDTFRASKELRALPVLTLLLAVRATSRQNSVRMSPLVLTVHPIKSSRCNYIEWTVTITKCLRIPNSLLTSPFVGQISCRRMFADAISSSKVRQVSQPNSTTGNLLFGIYRYHNCWFKELCQFASINALKHLDYLVKGSRHTSRTAKSQDGH